MLLPAPEFMGRMPLWDRSAALNLSLPVSSLSLGIREVPDPEDASRLEPRLRISMTDSRTACFPPTCSRMKGCGRQGRWDQPARPRCQESLGQPEVGGGGRGLYM